MNNRAELSQVKASSATIEETQRCDVQLDGERDTLPSRPTVWTPRFILLFFLTLVVGLSVESLLTQGWLNGAYKAEWVLLAHVLLILAAFIALSIKASISWTRLAGISGSTWAIFTGASYVTTLLGISSRSPVMLQFHAVIACALLATFICLSTSHIIFRRWDTIFFWLAPFAGASAVAVLYFLSRNDTHHTRVLISATTTVLLSLCFAVWWLRPSCWKEQSCMTFLFGIATLLLLFMPLIQDDVLGTPFFLSQVLLLCILLGVMRAVQGELVH